MRTFIAVDLNADIKNKIKRIIRELDNGTRSVRWVGIEGIHLTLKFLGDTTIDRAAQVGAALAEVGQNVSSFPLRIAGTGAFPPGSRPRVLWVGIDPSKDLRDLVASIEKAMIPLGFSQETRPFSPHITIGRVKDSSRLESVMSGLNTYKDRVFGQMTVQSLLFFESRLKPTGAEYSILKEIHLP